MAADGHPASMTDQILFVSIASRKISAPGYDRFGEPNPATPGSAR